MSTVKLKQTHKGLGAAGETVSVPFLKAREMVKAGVAEYPPQAPTPGAPAAEDGVRGELAAARKRVQEQAEEIRKLRAENAELKQLLDADAGPGKGDTKDDGKKK